MNAISTRRNAPRKTADTQQPKLLTVDAAAAISGESRWTWRARAYKGVVASVKIGNSQKARLLIPESEVLRLIEQGMRPAVVA